MIVSIAAASLPGGTVRTIEISIVADSSHLVYRFPRPTVGAKLRFTRGDRCRLRPRACLLDGSPRPLCPCRGVSEARQPASTRSVGNGSGSGDPCAIVTPRRSGMKKQALVGIDVSAQSLDVALERGQLEAADTRRRRAARFWLLRRNGCPRAPIGPRAPRPGSFREPSGWFRSGSGFPAAPDPSRRVCALESPVTGRVFVRRR